MVGRFLEISFWHWLFSRKEIHGCIIWTSSMYFTMSRVCISYRFIFIYYNFKVYYIHPHIPEYNVRCYYFSIRIFITPFHSRRNFRFILYSIFILRIVRIHPPRDVSFEFWLERYRWKWRMLVPLTKSIEENGRLTGIWRRGRERDTPYTNYFLRRDSA